MLKTSVVVHMKYLSQLKYIHLKLPLIQLYYFLEKYLRFFIFLMKTNNGHNILEHIFLVFIFSEEAKRVNYFDKICGRN